MKCKFCGGDLRVVEFDSVDGTKKKIGTCIACGKRELI